MHFVYEGFTHDGGTRRFTFRGIEERSQASVFSIEVALPLFAENRVSVQEGPAFCLQLLTTACLEDPTRLAKFEHYKVVGEDFRPLLKERERRAAEKALKKAPRRPFRKPPVSSNLRGLGRPSQQH
jgi:hypothetical protein